ncbi:Protein Brevis radix-like 1 [Acorus calamus]|uniref:Protein Brevis radix-like 1 n=1 Tax=Acorus calamus TaxID=4465 RepID=A0AAV9FQP4_ACOCL|nr:Protein Brevis radix-like 1 [Acorus calamus]
MACSKQIDDASEDKSRGTSSSAKESVKSLTSQMKDMALKLSGAYKQPFTPRTAYQRRRRWRNRRYGDVDGEGGSSSSIPAAWDFTTINADPPSDGGVPTEVGVGPKEWMAQMEPGVHITFVSLPSGGNDLKRIRFSKEMFNKWQAQRWWGENYDRIMELYNVQRFIRQGLTSPPRSSQDERAEQQSRPSLNGGVVETSRSSKDDEEVASTSNASDLFETEWVEQDEPGVYITIRALTDGTRELRRVRFSQERFGEVNAKMWWEENKERIQAQYL